MFTPKPTAACLTRHRENYNLSHITFSHFSPHSQPDSFSILSIPDQSTEQLSYILTVPLIKYHKSNAAQQKCGKACLTKMHTQKSSVNTLMHSYCSIYYTDYSVFTQGSPKGQLQWCYYCKTAFLKQLQALLCGWTPTGATSTRAGQVWVRPVPSHWLCQTTLSQATRPQHPAACPGHPSLLPARSRCRSIAYA